MKKKTVSKKSASKKFVKKRTFGWPHLAVLLVVGIAGVLAIHLTHGATQTQICGNDGTGYCMNAWNGGPSVRMYYGGKSHEDFFIEYVNECQGQPFVLSKAHGASINCPFNETWADNKLAGAGIVQIVYGPTGQCVGDAANRTGTAVLTRCNNTTLGGGGGTGTLQVMTKCSSGRSGVVGMVNKYETDWANNQTLQYVRSGGNVNTPLYMFGLTGTCWGGPGIDL